MECTFAINSNASGFVLLRDERGQPIGNGTLQRLGGDPSGSMNISDPPVGEYNVSVTVFEHEEDYTDNKDPLIELDEHLIVHQKVDHQSSSIAPALTDTVPGLCK